MQMPQTPGSEGPRTGPTDFSPQTPNFDDDESLAVVVRELSSYFADIIQAPHTFEQLRTASIGHILKPLVCLFGALSTSFRTFLELLL